MGGGGLVNPVANRTLVTVDPKDPARWLTAPQGSVVPPVTDQSGMKRGDLDGYKGIVLPGSIKKARVTKGVETTQEEIISDLKRGYLNEDQIKQLATHIKAGALALNGHYGQQVTLAGIDPMVAGVLVGNRKYDSFQGQMHISPSNVDHPLSFLGMDGVVEQDQFAEDNVNDGYGDFPQEIETLSSKELEKRGKILQVTLARAQAQRMEQQQQQHGHGGQQQQQHKRQGPNFDL